MSYIEMVENITTSEVADNKMYRDKLIELCNYVEELSFKHKPNYDKMISILHQCLQIISPKCDEPAQQTTPVKQITRRAKSKFRRPNSCFITDTNLQMLYYKSAEIQ